MVLLKDQLQSLFRDNQILKRAVAIQHERYLEQEEKTKEVSLLKHMISQFQEKIRTLEVINMACALDFSMLLNLVACLFFMILSPLSQNSVLHLFLYTSCTCFFILQLENSCDNIKRCFLVFQTLTCLSFSFPTSMLQYCNV